MRMVRKVPYPRALRLAAWNRPLMASKKPFVCRVSTQARTPSKCLRIMTATAFIGSTFERGAAEPSVTPAGHAANHERLARLLPALGRSMAPAFAPSVARGWSALRATLPDRLPAVGPVDDSRWPGLWVCAGLGARGISRVHLSITDEAEHALLGG